MWIEKIQLKRQNKIYGDTKTFQIIVTYNSFLIIMKKIPYCLYTAQGKRKMIEIILISELIIFLWKIIKSNSLISGLNGVHNTFRIQYSKYIHKLFTSTTISIHGMVLKIPCTWLLEILSKRFVIPMYGMYLVPT